MFPLPRPACERSQGLVYNPLEHGDKTPKVTGFRGGSRVIFGRPGMTELRDPAIRVVAMPADSNAYGDIFGGWLLSLMDNGAGLAAARRAKGRAVTVAMDGMVFHEPVKVGDEVSVYAEVEKVGRTSITISVEAWRRERHSEDASKVTQARFTFVAIDDEGRPRPVDP